MNPENFDYGKVFSGGSPFSNLEGNEGLAVSKKLMAWIGLNWRGLGRVDKFVHSKIRFIFLGKIVLAAIRT